MTDSPLLDQLAAYRLEQDLSFEQLATQMNEQGYFVRPRALHLMLTKRLRTRPHDRTLHKVKQFLARVDPHGTVSSGKKKTRRRSAAA